LEATQKQHRLRVANDPDHPEIQKELPDDPKQLEVEAIKAISSVVGRDLPEDETQSTALSTSSSLRQGYNRLFTFPLHTKWRFFIVSSFVSP